jgi:hypothetical protein
MSSLVLYVWSTNPVVQENDPDYATIVRPGEKIFVYDQDTTRNTIDATNKGIILKRFGKAKIQKVNDMAVNHMDAVNMKPNNGNATLNQLRLAEIKRMDVEFADFFLKRLHTLVWKDYARGVQSTIPFDDAFEMLKKATHALYDLLIAAVEDKFSKDLSISEMKNVIDLHNLNNEYTLGKDLIKKKIIK